MSPRIILSPGARANLQSAARWYRRQDPDLSRRFEAQVWATLLRIARHPYSFVRVYYVVHRALVTRFPYSIYFTFDGNLVRVLGIRHQRRADYVRTNRINDWQADE